VRWLVENNHPLREFETPAFQQLIAAANPDAERALWASRTSVSSFVMRLYDHMFPRVVADLSESISKIHISFDGWTTKGGKQGYLGMVAHYVNPCGELKDLPIALPQLMGNHSRVNTANVILRVLEKFGITSINMGYTVLDNASNNDTTVDEIAEVMGFNAAHRRLRCGPHTLNLIGQTLLWGKDSDAFDNDVRQHTEESESMKDWRRDGPLGVLLAVIKYIKTPQQYALFTEFQRLANSELPADAPAEAHKILQPVKPVVTRWNSYYSCFERAIQLQSAVTVYAESHISRVRAEDSYAASRRNKLPDAQPWMRSTGLQSADWQVVTEYMEVLKPLKAATKRLEGRGKSGRFGAVAEFIPMFDYILNFYEQRVATYNAVNYNAAEDAPEDHLAINLRAAWAKANNYYQKLDRSPAYYAATLLHPYYKNYCEVSWADRPDWLDAANAQF
jgi:hypothetical protein